MCLSVYFVLSDANHHFSTIRSLSNRTPFSLVCSVWLRREPAQVLRYSPRVPLLHHAFCRRPKAFDASSPGRISPACRAQYLRLNPELSRHTELFIVRPWTVFTKNFVTGKKNALLDKTGVEKKFLCLFSEVVETCMLPRLWVFLLFFFHGITIIIIIIKLLTI